MIGEETTSSTNGDVCIEDRRDLENDSGVQITFRADSDSDNHFIDSTVILGVQQMMRDIRVMNVPMEVQSFRSQPVYGVKFDVLQLNTMGQDRRVVPPSVKLIITPGKTKISSLVYNARSPKKSLQAFSPLVMKLIITPGRNKM